MYVDVGIMYLLNFALTILWVGSLMILFILVAIWLGIYERIYRKFNPIPESRFYKLMNHLRLHKGSRLLTDIAILAIFVIWVFQVPWSNNYNNRVYICLNNANEYHEVGACIRKLRCHPAVKEVYLWQVKAVRRNLCDNCYQIIHAPLPPYIE